MNILVVGAGAVGCIVGGYLTESGYNVTLADGWPANVNALNTEGLKLSGPRGDHHIRVKAVPLEDIYDLKGPFDIIFISVKSYDTASVVASIRPLVSSETVVISTQNGINEEFICSEIGSDHVIGAVPELSGYLSGPGAAVETRKEGGFILGELDGRDTPRVRKIASIMYRCGIIKISSNVIGLLWSKLIWNGMLNPLSAISGLGLGRILQNDGYRGLAIEIGKEGFRVSKKHDVSLEPLTVIGADLRRLDPDQPVEVEKEDRSIKALPEPLDKMPSMAQDIKNGRRVEIDYINGILIEWGKKLGVPTPLNEEIVKTVHAVEDNRQIQSPTLLDAIVRKFC